MFSGTFGCAMEQLGVCMQRILNRKESQDFIPGTLDGPGVGYEIVQWISASLTSSPGESQTDAQSARWLDALLAAHFPTRGNHFDIILGKANKILFSYFPP